MLSGVQVTPDTSDFWANEPTIVIYGEGFDPIVANNSIVFNDGAAGFVTAATANSLTVSLATDPPSAGVLTAAVTSNGESSGAASRWPPSRRS